jgi:hypothetical protein
MFKKFASNTLQDLADKCLLKSFSCENQEDSEAYRKISSKINGIAAKLEVEMALEQKVSSNG